MKMHYSVITIQNESVFEISECNRYYLILEGLGEAYTSEYSQELNLHNLFYYPINSSVIIRNNNPGRNLVCGIIDVEPQYLHYPRPQIYDSNDTGLIRQVFFLGLDNQDLERPNYRDVNAAINQLMYAAIVSVGVETNKLNAMVFDVVENITQNYSNPDYDVNVAIKKTGYSSDYFRRLFQSETQVTPAEFVTGRRLDHAANLLQHFGNNISIKDVALQCGYTDPYYFSRKFKQQFGVSPSKYIEK